MKAIEMILDGNRKPQLHSLIDMAFILLLFFLVTSMLANMGGTEQKLALPTPINRPGEAQIVIQIVDQDRFWFLGNDVRNMAVNVLQLPYSETDKKNQILDIFRKSSCNMASLDDRLNRLKKEAAENPSRQYFVLIRCPDEMPYGLVMEILNKLMDRPNIQYGCAGGSVKDFENASQFRIETVHTGGATQQNVVIQF